MSSKEIRDNENDVTVAEVNDSSNDDDSSLSKPTLNTDILAESLGCGIFQYLMTGYGGLCTAAEGSIIQSLSIIVIAACDLQINTANKGWLSLAFLIGLAISGTIWGRLCDYYQRRQLLQIATMVNIVSNLLSALSVNYMMLVIAGFLNGVGTGGVLPLSFVYTIEFFPKAHRGKAMCVLTSGSAFGALYGSVMAILIIPHPIDLPLGSIRFTSWRLYIIVCSLPLLLCFLIILWMPKSPRHLLKLGKIQTALQTANNISRWNQRYTSNRNKSDSYEYKPIFDEFHNIKLENNNSKINDTDNQASLIKLPWLKYIVISCIIWFFYYFANYGMWLWLPSLYMYSMGNETCLHHHQHNLMIFSNSSTSLNHSVCLDDDHQLQVYINTTFASIASIVSSLLVLFLMHYIGRKWLFCVYITLSGISVFFIWIINTSVGIVVFSCFFMALTNSAWPLLLIWGLELFPTEIRATACGVLYASGKSGAIVGTVIFAVFLNANCLIPILCVAIACFICGCIAVLLHDTSTNDID